MHNHRVALSKEAALAQKSSPGSLGPFRRVDDTPYERCHNSHDRVHKSSAGRLPRNSLLYIISFAIPLVSRAPSPPVPPSLFRPISYLVASSSRAIRAELWQLLQALSGVAYRARAGGGGLRGGDAYLLSLSRISMEIPLTN